jgi:hypothetical protein
MKTRSPEKIQRCASDTAMLDNPIDTKRPTSVHEGGKDEQGPWTSEEAFLLFDWWPPSLEKPAFWDAAAAAVASKPLPHQPPAAGPGNAFPPIRTARQFLSDDVNAL